MNRLTCIIPFLNEGIEVFRTVKSIRDTVGDQVDIILINDTSKDGVDYKVVANQFDCTYVVNSDRQGVAGSRDLGVELCKTEFCLLLDAHMRFYDAHWLTRIVEEVENNPRRIYCTGCRPLWYPFDDKPKNNNALSTGAYLKTSFSGWSDSLEAKWVVPQLKKLEPIPLVLGATYSFSKDYYIEIGGLSGLVTYGSDETWLSLKSWAIGEGCAVIGDVVIGHVFREKHPYATAHSDAIYNKLMIVSVICPDKNKWITELLKQGDARVIELLKSNWENITNMRSWFLAVQRDGWKETFNELNDKFAQNWEKL